MDEENHNYCTVDTLHRQVSSLDRVAAATDLLCTSFVLQLSLEEIINVFFFLHLFVAETPVTECSIRSQDDASGGVSRSARCIGR